MTLYYSYVEHPLTRLILFSSENGLRSIHFIPQGEPLPDPGVYHPNRPLQYAAHRHTEVFQQLYSYLEGSPAAFDVTLDLIGTAFQKRVWMAIAGIPYGKIMTYGEIAALVGSPKGSRAVGGATGRTPIPIIIP